VKLVYSKKTEPKYETLKKNKKTLTEEERKQVVDAGAVWHHGPNGEETPAVWKAEVDGNSWYVCNTHRAYDCKPTLKGAIKAYDFIETTASSEKVIKLAGRKRIRDRGINWKEAYHEKSQGLKKRYDKDIGGNSYMRYEGHDFTTDSDYFIIIGPALNKEMKKRFFSGIKKLPDDPKAKVYAPSGEYFHNIISAFSHASEKWALPFPKGTPEYTLADLANIEIARHIKG
tara:strand:- start:3050 stop:3736 length:687 start_codon:yes stop_codon:yes gene_type:complete